MFRIVTLEREFGSGGGAIAVKLAAGWLDALGPPTDQPDRPARSVTESAVASCDERVDSRLYRLAKLSGGQLRTRHFSGCLARI